MNYLTYLKSKRDLKIVDNFYYYRWFYYHTTFLGTLIFCGKKLKASKSMLNIKHQIKLREKLDPFWVFLIAMLKITPNIFLKMKGVKQAGKGVPFPIYEKKKIMFAIKWAIHLMKKRDRAIQWYFLIDLLISSFYGKGIAVRQKKRVHNIAIMNRYLIKRFFK